MPTAQFFAPGFDEQVEQQNIERQRKMADLLRQQSMEPTKGDMVSGHYVAPSVTQHLAKLLQGYYAGEGSRAADEKQRQLADAVRNRQSEEYGQFTNLMAGKPAQDVGTAAPLDESGYRQEGFKTQVETQPAVAPDINAAFKYAAQARTPALQQIGVQGSMNQALEQAKLAQAEAQRQKMLQLWGQSGNDPQKFMALGGDPKLAKEFAESGNWGKEELINVNGQLVGKLSGKQVGAAIPKQADAPNFGKDEVVPDGKGGWTTNVPLVNAKKEIATAGRAINNQVVNTGQKGFDNTLKLRGDFRSEPVYKAHQEMQSAYAQIGASLKASSPAGDLAAATKIMKLLDPGSVVRESELGMAMAATGLLDRIGSYATNVVNGTKLTPQQRKDFQSLADQLYTESVNQYNAKQSEYSQIAERNGLNVADVVGTPSKAPVKPSSPPAPTPAKRIRYDAQGNPIQ